MATFIHSRVTCQNLEFHPKMFKFIPEDTNFGKVVLFLLFNLVLTPEFVNQSR